MHQSAIEAKREGEFTVGFDEDDAGSIALHIGTFLWVFDVFCVDVGEGSRSGSIVPATQLISSSNGSGDQTLVL